jgi:hypothetical protein
MNVMFLFVFKYYADTAFYVCITQRLSFQVFTFIIMDLTINKCVCVLRVCVSGGAGGVAVAVTNQVTDER